MNTNIIYALKDPRTDEIRYVGKSIHGIERAKSHISHSHNSLVNEWINDLKLNNYIPDIIVLENVSNWSELIDKEKYWVGKLLNEEHDLLNVLITNDFNESLKSYNHKLKEQIEKHNKILEGKLNNILLQLGNELNVGELIKKRRKELKIGQKTLSELSGVGLRTLKEIELNKPNTTIKTLIKILDVLGFELFINLKYNISHF